MKYSKNYFQILFYLGLTLAVIVSFNRNYQFLNDFVAGLFSGLSIVFILIGGALSHSEKFKRRNELHVQDERLSMIRGKSYESMFFVSSIIGAILVVVFGFLGGKFIYITISIAIFLFIQKIIYLFSYKIILRRL